MEEITNEIAQIEFGILSPEEILKNSSCFVTCVKVCDGGENINSKYMGTIENNQLCKTCEKDVWTCQGHMGHIKLEYPVVNPSYVNHVANVLRCLCFTCYKFVVSFDHLKLEKNIKKFVDILLWIKTVKTCYWCQSIKEPIYVVNETIIDENKNKLDVYKILRVLENMDNETVRFLGFNPIMSHPKNFIFTIFPVIPPCCRPFVMSDENVCDDDLTYQFTEIIKNNQCLSDNYLAKIDSRRKKTVLQTSILSNKEIYEKHLGNLEFRISTLFNNTKKKAKHAATARPITTLWERISGKDGIIRNNLLGKRTDQSGRTVITADPTLKMDELGVPYEMAQILTIPVYVTSFNIAYLNKLVREGKVNFLIRSSEPKRNINLRAAINYRGTLLQFGDIIERNGMMITITDTKFQLKHGDVIRRNSIVLKDVKYPEPKNIVLNIGDLVRRQLLDGDWVILNRQPTLHKASMMAMKVVVKPVKTLSINLAITKPFNCDFDGDEMNIHVPQSYEAVAELQELSSSTKCIMSHQNSKPYMAIVQDALIGMFLLSQDKWEEQTITRSQFFDLLMVIGVYSYKAKARQIHEIIPNSSLYNGKSMLSFLFPNDFTFKTDTLTIQDGVFVDGVFEKNMVNLCIKILYKDYGEKIVSAFIDNVQFMSNRWLLERGFTIHAEDCLKFEKESPDIMKNSFIKAQTLGKIIKTPSIKEAKTISILTACTDQCMKKSKDALAPSNNFKVTEESGAKGSIFNICQITSLLGQQTIDGRRVSGLVHPQDNDFKNRGFIERSFVEGLSPREFFHHAMAGRKGVIDTALSTGISGYGQRQGVKLNEDIKICSDYTVRDTTGRLYQYIFGEAGYDPAQIIHVDGHPTFVNIYRLVQRLLAPYKHKKTRLLTEMEIAYMTDYICPRPHIPISIENRICEMRRGPVASQLKSIHINDDIIPALKYELETRFYQSLMSPGECVGIIGAQSLGEFSTQATLNTFHTAGSNTTGLVTNCLTRFQEINNASKNPKMVSCKIYFTTGNLTIEQIRHTAGYNIKYMVFNDFIHENYTVSHSYTDEWWYKPNRLIYGSPYPIAFKTRIRFALKKQILYEYKIYPAIIKTALEIDEDIHCVFSPFGAGFTFDVLCNAETDSIHLFLKCLKTRYVCGLEGVRNIYFAKDDALNVWYVQTEGGILKNFYTLPNIDIYNTTTSNIWDIYNTLGIEAVREQRIKEFLEIVGTGVDISHIKLRVDRMVFSGTIQSLTRYTMRGEKPFSKVGFEESMENFYKIAKDAEVDDISGISASIMCGKRVKAGTNMFGLKMDWDRFDSNDQYVDYEYND